MLTVLHIILRILLVILIAVLIIILLLLIVPVRYRADLKSGSGEPEEKFSLGTVKKGLDLKLDFWWLLKFINGRLALDEDGSSFRLRVMFIPIPINTKKAAEEAKEAVDKKKEKQKEELKQRVSDKANRIIDIYNRTGTDSLKRILGKGYKKVSGVLKGVLPTSLMCRGIVGTGDPANTGKVFMIASIVKGLLGETNKKADIDLDADMDNARLQIEAGIKGRIFLVSLVAAVFWFLTDRDVSRLRKALKKGKTRKRKSGRRKSEQEEFKQEESEKEESEQGKELKDERE